MATLREAEQARDEHAEALRQLGAHAISVEEETQALDAELGVVTAEPPVAANAEPTEDGGAAEPPVAASAEEPTEEGGATASSGARTDIGDGPGAGTGEQSGAGSVDEKSRADLSVGSTVADQAVGDAQPRQKRRSYAVVAWFEGDPPADLPRELEIQAGTRTKVVQLRARRTERFRAE